MATRILFAVLCMIVSTVSSAAVFKSVDANGKVVYSDRPSDNTVKISMINAAVMTPVYEKKASPAPAPAMPKVAFLQDSWSGSQPEIAALAARGLNARGEQCARVAAVNAKAAALKAGAPAPYAASK